MRKKKLKKWSWYYLLIWVVIALLAPVLANEKPLFVSTEQGFSFPFLSEVKPATSTFSLSAPIPYSPGTIDYQNANGVSPFGNQNISALHKRHWLGTDKLGRDVLANMIHGSRTALLIGFGAMFLAAIIGISLGSISAYFGDSGIKMNILYFILFLTISIFTFIFISVIIPWEINSVSVIRKLLLATISIALATSLFYILKYTTSRFNAQFSTVKLPVDLLIGRIIEIMESIPILFLLIALSTLIKPSIPTVILIIGLAAWSSIAKFTRAEFLKAKNSGYVESGKALGLKNRLIILKHILPNAISPVIITLAFGLAAAILLESTLSFMGFGISNETASWGKLLADARQNYEAWWLTLFPGLAIFVTVLSCNNLGDELSKRN